MTPIDLTSMTVEVAVQFDSPPEGVWDLLTDVERMAGLGPEHVRARWLAPVPEVGARFEGWNRMGDREWNVICVVTACRRPECFGWNVGVCRGKRGDVPGGPSLFASADRLLDRGVCGCG